MAKNGWVVKHVHYNDLGILTDFYYTILVEKKNWLGITRHKTMVEYCSNVRRPHYRPRRFKTAEEAEAQLVSVLHRMDNKFKKGWTTEIVKSIVVG